MRRALVQYNKLPCDGAPLMMGGSQVMFGEDEDKVFAEEPMTLSGLKAMYR